MPAPKGNRYAAREGEKKTSRLLIPVTPAEKARIVRDAGGQKVAAYVREKLLGKAGG